MHNNGIFHSFIVPRNIIECENDKYAIVGYGYSALCNTEHVRPNEVSENDKRYRAPECNDEDHLGALWFPADIYSIGAILYHIAMGEPPPPPDQLPRDIQRLKKHIYETLKGKEGEGTSYGLFTGNENILKIIDKCLRYDPEDRFSCAEELLDLIEIAESSKPNNEEPSSYGIANATVAIKKHAGAILNDSCKKSSAPEEDKVVVTPFRDLAASLCSQFTRGVEQCGRGHFEVYGHRDAIVTSLCRLLSSARNNDKNAQTFIYRTMSMCSYWTDDNLGSNGRFLTMNKHMARQGLKTQRIFRVGQDFHELTETEQLILEHHYRAWLDMKDYGAEKDFDIVVYREPSNENLLDFELKGQPVGYLAKEHSTDLEKEEDTICFNFISRNSLEWNRGVKKMHRKIHKIRYWSPKMLERDEPHKKEQKDFLKVYEKSIPLAAYMGRDPDAKEDKLPTLSEILSQ